MIWIDSSFAIEWLAELDRVKNFELPKETLSILPSQYTETFVFFLRKGIDQISIFNSLEVLNLQTPDKLHLQLAASLYVKARGVSKNKVSLADATLAAVAKERKEKILAFDSDFSQLGFKQEKGGVWVASSN